MCKSSRVKKLISVGSDTLTHWYLTLIISFDSIFSDIDFIELGSECSKISL